MKGSSRVRRWVDYELRVGKNISRHALCVGQIEVLQVDSDTQLTDFCSPDRAPWLYRGEDRTPIVAGVLELECWTVGGGRSTVSCGRATADLGKSKLAWFLCVFPKLQELD